MNRFIAVLILVAAGLLAGYLFAAFVAAVGLGQALLVLVGEGGIVALMYFINHKFPPSQQEIHHD